MKVIIDPDKCIASGACVLANPDVFGQDEDGIVTLLIERPEAEDFLRTRTAVGACPAMAIELEESE